MEEQNFISVDKQTVINSYGVFYKIGEEVMHQDKEAGKATIKSFTCVEDENEIIVNTTSGYARIDFLEKI